MFVVALALGIMPLALAPTLDNLVDQPFAADPNYVVGSGGIGGIVLFLFALVTVMNSVSGEFESGTIVSLLTKPVSRTMVFLGKLSAAVVTLLPVYVLLFTIDVVGGTIVYGPQNNLYLVPLSLLGSMVSTLVWLAIVLAIGSVSKSSLLAALGAFLAYVSLSISSGIISVFGGEAWVLTYLPGSGAIIGPLRAFLVFRCDGILSATFTNRSSFSSCITRGIGRKPLAFQMKLWRFWASSP